MANQNEMETSPEDLVRSEAQALRNALRLLGQSGGSQRQPPLVPSGLAAEQANMLERLIDQPDTTPSSRQALRSSLRLVDRAARRLTSAELPKQMRHMKRRVDPEVAREVQAETVNLGRALQEAVNNHRKTIDEIDRRLAAPTNDPAHAIT